MARPSSDYTRCPECGRRTVLFHFGRNGEDYLRCTRCDWQELRYPDSTDAAGRANVARWEAANEGSDS